MPKDEDDITGERREVANNLRYIVRRRGYEPSNQRPWDSPHLGDFSIAARIGR